LQKITYFFQVEIPSKSLIAEYHHPKTQNIHIEPPPRLAHEIKEPKRQKITNLLEVLPHTSVREVMMNQMILALASLYEVNPSALST
jgi:hypothetical protein